MIDIVKINNKFFTIRRRIMYAALASFPIIIIMMFINAYILDGEKIKYATITGIAALIVSLTIIVIYYISVLIHDNRVNIQGLIEKVIDKKW